MVDQNAKKLFTLYKYCNIERSCINAISTILKNKTDK